MAARLSGANLWLGYATVPVEVGLFLWMLSVLQATEFLRTAYVMAIPVTGVVVLAMLLLTDPAQTFYRWVAPGLALMALAASLGTLVLRSLESRAPLALQDWFWFTLGLSLFWLNLVSITIFYEAFVNTHLDWVATALLARAYVDITACLLMSWGLLQPWLRARSSGSS